MNKVLGYSSIVILMIFLGTGWVMDNNSEKEESIGQKEIIEAKWLREASIEEKEVYYIEPAMKIHAAFDDKLYATSLEFNKLYYSEDSGATWNLMHAFDTNIQTVYFSPLGEMFVSIATDRFSPESDGVILKFDEESQKFKEVLTIESGAVYTWNIDGDEDGYLVVSEYGYKSFPNNARRLYQSKDSGETWEVIYEPNEEDNYHNHKIVIDEANPSIIYQSVGDGLNNQLMRSLDRGETWTTLKTGFNPISVIQTSDFFVWGTDTHPKQGIYVMEKDSGEIVNHFYPDGFAGSIYDMVELDGRMYAGFSSYEWESQWWDGTVWSSDDEGFTWDLDFKIEKTEGYGIGFYKMVVDSNMVYINSSYYPGPDSERPPYTGTIRFGK